MADRDRGADWVTDLNQRANPASTAKKRKKKQPLPSANQALLRAVLTPVLEGVPFQPCVARDQVTRLVYNSPADIPDLWPTKGVPHQVFASKEEEHPGVFRLWKTQSGPLLAQILAAAIQGEQLGDDQICHGLRALLGTIPRSVIHSPDTIQFVRRDGTRTPIAPGFVRELRDHKTKLLLMPWHSQNPAHWALFMVDLQTHTLYVFDSASLSDNRVGWVSEFVRLYAEAGMGTLRAAWDVPFSRQRDGWSCGFWVLETAYRILGDRATTFYPFVGTRLRPGVGFDNMLQTISNAVAVQFVRKSREVSPAPSSRSTASLASPPRDTPQADTSIRDREQEGGGLCRSPIQAVAGSDTMRPPPPKKHKVQPTGPFYSYPAGTRYDQVIDLEPQLAPQGADRFNQFLEDNSSIAYRWPGMSLSLAARIPQVHYPLGWRGWADFERRMEAVRDQQDQASEQKAAREERRLARQAKK